MKRQQLIACFFTENNSHTKFYIKFHFLWFICLVKLAIHIRLVLRTLMCCGHFRHILYIAVSTVLAVVGSSLLSKLSPLTITVSITSEKCSQGKSF